MTSNDHDPRDDARDVSRDSTDAPGGLRSVLASQEPPPGLENRVVASLSSRGLLESGGRSSRWHAWRAMGLLAAAVALFVAGGMAERARTADPAPQDVAALFAILLYDGPRTATPEAEAALVAEYGAWARELAASGRLVTGEKLGDDAIELRPESGGSARARSGPGTDVLPLQGFFVVGASSLDEARALAATIPHLSHGGRVVVRPIDPT